MTPGPGGVEDSTFDATGGTSPEEGAAQEDSPVRAASAAKILQYLILWHRPSFVAAVTAVPL